MKRILGVLFAACLAISGVLPVFAQTVQPQPDSMSIVSVEGYTDLVETGDAAILVHWDIRYPSTYTTDNYSALNAVSVAFLLEMYETDGATLLATATPYTFGPFQTNGYEQGVSSVYFSATDALPIDQPYIFRLQESALYFTSPTSANYTMVVATDWAHPTQDDFKAGVLQMCDLFLSSYPTLTLKSATDIGMVLAGTGESYFQGAVTGIRQLCPELFYVQDFTPVEMTVTPYDSTIQDQYSIRMQGSEIKRGADRLMAHFGLTGYFGLGMGVLVACIGAGIFTSKRGWGLEPGLIGASIISVGGALLIGNAVFTIVMIGTLIAVMAIMFSYFGRRA